MIIVNELQEAWIFYINASFTFLFALETGASCRINHSLNVPYISPAFCHKSSAILLSYGCPII